MTDEIAGVTTEKAQVALIQLDWQPPPPQHTLYQGTDPSADYYDGPDCTCHGADRPHTPHQPCDKGCQPDWHRDDCAIYLALPPAESGRPSDACGACGLRPAAEDSPMCTRCRYSL